MVYADKARQQPELVLTGSTNLSLTGLYVNANHVLVFDDREIAGVYADVFQKGWTTKVRRTAFAESALATNTHNFAPLNTGPIEIDFSPHLPTDKDKVLGRIVERIARGSATGNSSPDQICTVSVRFRLSSAPPHNAGSIITEQEIAAHIQLLPVTGRFILECHA